MSIKEKIMKWMIEDIKEQISWSDAVISDQRIREIAEEKTDDLINKCLVK